MSNSGSFTAPGLSVAYVPPTANMPFFVQMGPGSGLVYLSMASVASPAQSDFALQFGPDGNAIVLRSAGAVQLFPPFSALPYGVAGTVAPSFQLSCKALFGGTTSWSYQFSQP
jgi:hypothetical protein